MYNKKLPGKGWATSDARIAAVLMCAGGEFDQLALITGKESPGVFLRDATGKESEESNFTKATEKVKKFGYEIIGIFWPRGKSYKVFIIKGDPEKFEDIVDRWSGKKRPPLEYNVVEFADKHRMLVSLLKDSDAKIDPEVQRLYEALRQGKEEFYKVLEEWGWVKRRT